MMNENAIILVQEIIIQWTPKSRGTADASERNAMPEAFLLPYLGEIQYPHAIVHDRVTFPKGDSHHIEIRAFLPPQNSVFRCVWIGQAEANISVTFRYIE